MANQKLESLDTEFGEVHVGERVVLIEDYEDMGIEAGEEGEITSITQWSDTMNDRIDVQVRIDGMDEPIEIPPRYWEPES